MILADETATARLGSVIAAKLQRGEAVCLSGPLVSPATLEGDPAEVTTRLQAYVEATLPADHTRAFG